MCNLNCMQNWNDLSKSDSVKSDPEETFIKLDNNSSLVWLQSYITDKLKQIKDVRISERQCLTDLTRLHDSVKPSSRALIKFKNHHSRIPLNLAVCFTIILINPGTSYYTSSERINGFIWQWNNLPFPQLIVVSKTLKFDIIVGYLYCKRIIFIIVYHWLWYRYVETSILIWCPFFNCCSRKFMLHLFGCFLLTFQIHFLFVQSNDRFYH